MKADPILKNLVNKEKAGRVSLKDKINSLFAFKMEEGARVWLYWN